MCRSTMMEWFDTFLILFTKTFSSIDYRILKTVVEALKLVLSYTKGGFFFSPHKRMGNSSTVSSLFQFQNCSVSPNFLYIGTFFFFAF